MPAPSTAPSIALKNPKSAIPNTAPASAPTAATAPISAPTPAEIEANITASLLKVERARQDSRTAAVRVYRALGAKLADNTELGVAEAEALQEALRVLDISAERLAADVRAVALHRMQLRLAQESHERHAALEPRTREWAAELDALEARKREIAAEQWAYQGALTAAGQHTSEAARLASAHRLLIGTEEAAIRAVCEPPSTRPEIIRSSPPIDVAVPADRNPAELPAHIPTWG